MTTLHWLVPLMAFLGPMPRPLPERPEPLPGNEWVAAFVMGAVFFLMVGPMVMIWGFSRPEASFRAACEASGGRVAFTSLSGDGPRRCDRPVESGSD